MILEGRNLTFAYEEREGEVFSNVNLRVESHERVAVLGPSGFGKTTLCKILAGYLKPLSGEVLLDGRPLPAKGYCPVQMIWQHPEKAVNPKLRMRDTLADGNHVPERIVQELGIEPDWMNRYPQELSGGELQRFCIARALAVQPEVLLMDESTSALDPISTSKIEDLVAELKKDYTIVMVTHNMQQAARISDNTVFFLLGEVIEQNKTEELFSMPKDKRTEDYISGRFG